VNAARKLAGSNLEYNFKFALRPESVTWKEFYELLAEWKKTPHPETISSWIAKQTAAHSIARTDIEADLYQTLLNAKHQAASNAAEASTVENNAAYCAEAKSLLTMTGQFLALPGMFTPERFGGLYKASLYWIAFRANSADGDLRSSERHLLLALVDRTTDDDAPVILEVLKPMGPWAFHPEDGETMQLKKELRDECIARLLPKVENAFPAYLNRPESLRLLSTPQGSSAFRYVLFSPDRIPWAPVIREALLEMLRKAKSDQNAYDKANELLQLLLDAAGKRSNYIDCQSAVSIAEDRDFIVALWQGVTSRHVQFRMLKSYLSKREALVQLGVHEDDLPLSPELANARKTDGGNETQNGTA